MNENKFSEDTPEPIVYAAATGNTNGPEESSDNQPLPGLISQWLESITHLGINEGIIRFGTHVFSIVLIVGVVWLLSSFYRQTGLGNVAASAAALPTATPGVNLVSIPISSQPTSEGIARLASMDTVIPSRPRIDVIQYSVQLGDTVFFIAEKFGLDPETILWGNYYILRDDPHNLAPGQELNILPVNGTYYEWNTGDGLNGVASYFGVAPEEIVLYPGNHLDPTTIGDYANPNIEPGTWLIIPGGRREFVSWSAPVGVTRDNPAVARIIGDGACGAISGGAVGYGTFIWPADAHYLSGNDYSPESNHRGIDLSGYEGAPIYATDAGVIVYAGWNDYGYGYMVIIDHGLNWQSLYAHLSAINVSCGQSVGQGDVIAAMGSTGRSTGPHLHFELMHSEYGKVNPWNFLP